MPIVPSGLSGTTNNCSSLSGCSEGVSSCVSVDESFEFSADDSVDDPFVAPIDVSVSVDVSPAPSAGNFGTASGSPEVAGAVLNELKM